MKQLGKRRRSAYMTHIKHTVRVVVIRVTAECADATSADSRWTMRHVFVQFGFHHSGAQTANTR